MNNNDRSGTVLSAENLRFDPVKINLLDLKSTYVAGGEVCTYPVISLSRESIESVL